MVLRIKELLGKALVTNFSANSFPKRFFQLYMSAGCSFATIEAVSTPDISLCSKWYSYKSTLFFI
jgi:hypothetical protein